MEPDGAFGPRLHRCAPALRPRPRAPRDVLPWPDRAATLSAARSESRTGARLGRGHPKALIFSCSFFRGLGTEETPVLPRRALGRGSLACRRARIGRRNDGPRREGGRSGSEQAPGGGASASRGGPCEPGPEPGRAKEQGPTCRKKPSDEGSTCGRWLRCSSRISDPRTRCAWAVRSRRVRDAGGSEDTKARGRRSAQSPPCRAGGRRLVRPPPRAPGRKIQKPTLRPPAAAIGRPDLQPGGNGATAGWLLARRESAEACARYALRATRARARSMEKSQGAAKNRPRSPPGEPLPSPPPPRALSSPAGAPPRRREERSGRDSSRRETQRPVDDVRGGEGRKLWRPGPLLFSRPAGAAAPGPTGPLRAAPRRGARGSPARRRLLRGTEGEGEGEGRERAKPKAKKTKRSRRRSRRRLLPSVAPTLQPKNLAVKRRAPRRTQRLAIRPAGRGTRGSGGPISALRLVPAPGQRNPRAFSLPRHHSHA
jgi:hypothetical protein